MPRKTSVAIVDVSGVQRIPLADIPADVVAYVEEVYEKQRKAPGRERASYDTEKEMNDEWKQIVDYCSQRPAKLGGVLSARRSPSRGLPSNTMDFRVTADLEANGKKNATAESGQVKR